MLATIRQLLRCLTPYPCVLPGVAVLGTIAALAEGLSIGLMIPFIAAIMNDEASGGGVLARLVTDYAAIFPQDMRLAAVSASVVALVLASCSINYAYIKLLSWAATRVACDLRVKLFQHLVETDDLFIAVGSQGRLLKAIDGGAYRAGQSTIGLCLIVASLCTAVVFGVLLLLISWLLTLLVLCGVAVAGLIVRLLIRQALRTSRDFEARSAKLSDSAIKVVSGLRMVRMFGQERREQDRFAAEAEGVRRAEFRLESIRRAMAPLIDGLTVPVLITTLVLAYYNGVSATVLLPFLLLVFRLQRYVREIDTNQAYLASDAGAIMDISDLLETRATIEKVPPAPRQQGRFAREIAFDAVSFTHEGLGEQRGPSVEDITLTIGRGETLGIVGASGSGKSTLVNLLLGLYRPTAGELRIDGVPLGALDLASWRRRIGFSGQDAELLSGNIAENIAYGWPEAPVEAIRAAAAQANILDFITRLPEGFETNVGARGLKLSGGERQRIALARALLRSPELLILDEATNAVDNTSEVAIRDTLRALKGSTTMIVIAHRLSSIRHADRIVVMEAGRIVESGTSAELLASKGAFSLLSSLDDVTTSKAS